MSILRNLLFRRRKGRGTASHVPNYFINLINEIEESDKQKLAVFLDKDSSTTSLLVFLYCVNHLSKRFPKYMKEFAEKNWQLGDRVKVLPGNHVFEYAGILERDTSFLWLKLLDKDDRRTLPIKEIARLEKTESKRPKGTFKTPFPDQDRSPQDIVLGPDVATYGNLDIFPNICFVLGKASNLKNSFNNIEVREKHFPTTMLLSEVYPFGSLNSYGEIISSDINQTEQSPIVALSASYDNIFVSADRNEQQIRTIFYDGFERIKEFPDYPLPDNSRELLILDRKDLEDHKQITDRGYELRLISDQELMRNNENNEILLHSIFSRPYRSARNRSELVIEFIEVESKTMDTLFESMMDLADEIDRSAGDEKVDQLFLSLIGLFYDLSEICFFIPNHLIDKLVFIENSLKILILNQSLSTSFSKTITSFKKVLQEYKDTISPKGRFIKEKKKELDSIYDQGWKILSRNEVANSADLTNQQFVTLDPDNVFEKAIIVGWPNKRRFEKFWNSFSCREMTFLTYSYEKDLFLNFFFQQETILKRISNKHNLNSSNKFLSEILDEYRNKASQKHSSRVTTKEQSERIIERIESRLEKKSSLVTSEDLLDQKNVSCRLTYFSEGEAYAWITESHNFYVLDSLLLERNNNLNIPTCKLTDLEKGNFVLFRQKGEKEVLSLLAEEIIGKDKYDQLIQISQLWRDALLSFSSTRAAFQSLKDSGIERTYQTVSNWMKENSIICPEKKSDLKIINSSISEEYKFDVDSCFRAAETIRSLHISAGNKLTQNLIDELKRSSLNLNSGLNKVKLSFGTIWIAELEEINPEVRYRHASEVNSLILVDF